MNNLTKPIQYLTYFLIAIVVMGCSNKGQNNSNRNDLKLRLKASYAGLVGYGAVYNCEVVEVLEGQFEEDTVTLTVLAMDKANYETLSKHQSPTVIEVTFSKEEEQVEYGLMPLTGMVDQHKTAWVAETITVLE